MCQVCRVNESSSSSSAGQPSRTARADSVGDCRARRSWESESYLGRAGAILGERASRPLIWKTNLSLLRGRDARSPKVPVSTVHCKSSQPTTILSLGASGLKHNRRGNRACLFCSRGNSSIASSELSVKHRGKPISLEVGNSLKELSFCPSKRAFFRQPQCYFY